MVQYLSSAKTVAWQRRVRRFQKAGMTVVGFCEAEGVSTASFYRWRKKLAAQPTSTRNDEHTPAFRAVRVTPAGAAVAIRLPGGARVEVPTANLDAVRAVLGELLRHDSKQDHYAELERGRSRC